MTCSVISVVDVDVHGAVPCHIVKSSVSVEEITSVWRVGDSL